MTVDDCVPVDLGQQIDFADILEARARRAQEAEGLAAAPPIPGAVHVLDEHPSGTTAAPAPAAAPVGPPSAAQRDAQALRRLFLELPAVSRELRLLHLPEGLPVFELHQALLLRLHMASLNVTTMPALAWAAPDQPLTAEDQDRRSRQTLIARDALDEAWSLLARLQLAGHEQWPSLLEEADRICANLETGLSLRRAPRAERTEPTL